MRLVWYRFAREDDQHWQSADRRDRLVYLVDGDDLVILQARYHY